MAWVKLDDHFFSHPKVLPLSKGAKLLYLSGLTYASAQLTDGRLNAAAVVLAAKIVSVAPKLADELAEAGLWEADGDGYAIHDYLTYNPAREKVLSVRKATADRVSSWRGKHAGNGPSNGVTDAFVTRDVTPPRANSAGNAAPVPIPSPSPTTSERQPEKTDINVLPATARAGSNSLVPLNGGSPQHALLAVAKIALGFNGQTVKEQARENAAAGQLWKAGVDADELRDLIAEWRKRGWPNPSLSAIAGRLGQLRAPNEPGRKIAEADEPRGFEGIREAFADLDPRRAS